MGMIDWSPSLPVSAPVFLFSLLDPLLERLGLVKLRSGKAVALGVGGAVRVPHAVGDGALVGRGGTVKLGVVLARVGVGALHLLPIGRTGKAGTHLGEKCKSAVESLVQRWCVYVWGFWIAAYTAP